MMKGKIDGMETVGKLIAQEQPDVMLQTLVRALTVIMESEANARCGAEYGERDQERTNTRNGYRERVLETRIGTAELRIPKLRTGSYLPSFLEPRRRWEQAFMSVISEAYVKGVSTRKVDDLVKAMGATGMSKSEVSRLCMTLDEEVEAFRRRRLEKEYPYLWLDAVYLKVRDGKHVVSKATLVAGVHELSGEAPEAAALDQSAGETESRDSSTDRRDRNLSQSCVCAATSDDAADRTERGMGREQTLL